jgi:hypothetical protein
VVLSEEFAALHLRFAARVSEFERIELTDALQRWTPAGRQAGRAWSEIGSAPDAHALASAYRYGSVAAVEPRFGCFWQEPLAGGLVLRIHFANREGLGALGPDRLEKRCRELAATLRDARATASHAAHVRCGSWLYNLPRYRALFPPSLLATAAPADPRRHLGSLTLWGQFLRGDGRLYEPRVAPFVQAFEQAADSEDLLAAFPLARLDMTGSIDHILAWLETGSDG